jgi:hypothetical protein
MTTPFGLDIVNQAPMVSFVKKSSKHQLLNPLTIIRQGTKLWVRCTRLNRKDIRVVSRTLICVNDSYSIAAISRQM